MRTFDQYQHDLTLIPDLPRSAVEEALKNAWKQLPAWNLDALLQALNLDELHRQVNADFRQYDADYLWLQAFKGVSPSARAKWIEQFSRGVRQAPGADGDPVALSAWFVIERAKDRHWKGQTLDQKLLPKATRLALNLERRRIRIGLKQKRRQKASRKIGNPPMEILIHKMALLWMEFFDSFPGVSVARRKPEGKRREVGGPFIEFVQTLLCAYADCLSAEINGICPDLRDSLLVSSHPRAIAARLRRFLKGESEQDEPEHA